MLRQDIASTFSKHFRSFTDSLNLFSWLEDAPMPAGNDEVNSNIKKFAFHLSTKVARGPGTKGFAFCAVNVTDEHTKPKFKRKFRG